MNHKREQLLMNRLELAGRMELTEAVELLNVSESTARRLFSKLEEEGKLIRVHGGVRIPGKHRLEYSFEEVVQFRMKEKQAIGARACEMLQDGDVVFCDTGTTMLCFCMELRRRMEERPLDIRVYTNSQANFEVLAPSVPITLLGGEYRPKRKDFIGYLTELAVSKVHFTKCFLGTDGCDMKRYFTTTDFETARMDEVAMGNADEIIILCDSDKFYSCAQVGYAEFSQVDCIVTDVGITQEIQRQLEGHGMEIIIA